MTTDKTAQFVEHDILVSRIKFVEPISNTNQPFCTIEGRMVREGHRKLAVTIHGSQSDYLDVFEAVGRDIAVRLPVARLPSQYRPDTYLTQSCALNALPTKSL